MDRKQRIMNKSEFYYELPEELIAQTPIEPRDHSKMLVINQKTGNIEHKHFYDLLSYLTPNDVLVVNNTRVIPARLYGKKETGAKTEVLILKRLDLLTAEVLVKPGRKAKAGTKIYFTDDFYCTIISEVEEIGGKIVESYRTGRKYHDRYGKQASLNQIGDSSYGGVYSFADSYLKFFFSISGDQYFLQRECIRHHTGS